MLTRRRFLERVGQGYVAAHLMPVPGPWGEKKKEPSMRCINVVNFIREIEPRFPMDMMLPVTSQMEIIRRHGLPATWLLQFDALVSGPFVPFLKEQMPDNHEVGFWFEMNEKHCRAADVEWRGRPGYEWDHLPPVAFTIGYTREERLRLADTAMREFKRIWGRHPSSVASWNLDSVTIAHLVEEYGVSAFAVCRDQIATDGFTIWGAPIAGYYPSRRNCWSPAVDEAEQIKAPIFRMLGQDPVYYYQREWSIRGGSPLRTPDTMEPAWPSGQDAKFVESFLTMMEETPSLQFAYAQLGQENTFPWDQQRAGYGPQMMVLAEMRDRGVVHVETMGDSGRRFQQAFERTPAQAQIMLDDPFGNTDPARGSIWYQSSRYRADLHLRGDQFYLRDLTVYSDRLEQPYLNAPTRLNDVEQRMPAVLDGFHWSRNGEEPAGAYFVEGATRLSLAGKPRVREEGALLEVDLPLKGGRAMQVRFTEGRLKAALGSAFALSFEWDSAKASLVRVTEKQLQYRWQGFEYAVNLISGKAAVTDSGVRIEAENGRIELAMTQP